MQTLVLGCMQTLVLGLPRLLDRALVLSKLHQVNRVLNRIANHCWRSVLLSSSEPDLGVGPQQLVFQNSWRETAARRLAGDTNLSIYRSNTSEAAHRAAILSIAALDDVLAMLRSNCDHISTAESICADRFDADFAATRQPLLLKREASACCQSPEKFKRNKLLEQHGEHQFHINAWQDGRDVTMTLANFCHYCACQDDADPLYLFDCCLPESLRAQVGPLALYSGVFD
mmetsp:Transcript_13150/g.21874  ORF Transcript_13150/g.21874 Transcript_13150/m.21874 type:complete len:229 (-) Transcript_13150:102-788(-)